MDRAHSARALLPFAAMSAGADPKPAVQYLDPDTLPAPNGYSHVAVVRGGRTLYVSGQIAMDRAGQIVGKDDLRAQTRQVFENLKAALAAGGATLDDVVKITTFLRDASQVATVREVRASYFTKHHPASTLVEVSRLVRPELLIEIEAVAVVP